tara:strand:+ start:642 stop:779 length:138 start_codon:yes stop_codon:yes gene_type:complete
MSTLANEMLLESIYEEMVEEFRTGLFNWTQEEIDTEVYKRFEDRS